MKKTLDQQRAGHAWEVIEKIKSLPENDTAKKTFKTEIKKTPVRIKSAGLGPTLAFLSAKKSAPDLVDALSRWIDQRRPDSTKDLLKRIIEGDARFLQFATVEALAYLQWLVRFAEAQGLTGSEG